MKQWIPTPRSDGRLSGELLGVSLNAGEQVRWVYTILSDGRRVVTGYDIIPPGIPQKRKKNVCRVSKNKSSQ